MHQTTNYEDIKMKFMTYRNFDKALSRVFPDHVWLLLRFFSLFALSLSVESIWSVFFCLHWLRQKRLLSLNLCFFRVWMRVLCGRMWTKNALVSCTGSHRLQIRRLTLIVLFWSHFQIRFFFVQPLAFHQEILALGCLSITFMWYFRSFSFPAHKSTHSWLYTRLWLNILSFRSFFFTFPMHLYHGQTFSRFSSSAALIREKIPSSCDNAIVIK